MPTYKAIATVTVGSGGAANIQFTSIPQTYTDLMLLINARSTYSSGTSDCDLVEIQFNSTSTGYSGKRLYAITPSTVGSGTTPVDAGGVDVGPISAATSTTNTFGTVEVYIPNYTSSNYKSISAEGVQENNGNVQLEIIAALWSNTAAITSIKLLSNHSSNFVQYSTATLYGIKNS